MITKTNEILFKTIVKIDVLLNLAKDWEIKKEPLSGESIQKSISWLDKASSHNKNYKCDAISVANHYFMQLKTDFNIGIINLLSVLNSTDSDSRKAVKKYILVNYITQQPISKTKQEILDILLLELT